MLVRVFESIPIESQTWMDLIAAGGVVFTLIIIWVGFSFAYEHRKTQMIEIITLHFLFMLAFGGTVHIVSHFIANGHLSAGVFVWLRTTNCTIFELWGEYVVGFGVWFTAIMLKIMTWYITYHPPAWTGRLASVCRSDTLALRSGVRTLISIGSLVMLTCVCVAVEVGHGILYDSELGYCHTELIYKAAIVVGLCFCCVQMGVTTFVLLSSLKDKRIESYKEIRSVATVSTYSLLLMLFLNVSGWDSHSWARSADMIALCFMYAYSIWRMIWTPFYSAARARSKAWHADDANIMTVNELAFESICKDTKRLQTFKMWLNSRGNLVYPKEFDEEIHNNRHSSVTPEQFHEQIQGQFVIVDSPERDEEVSEELISALNGEEYTLSDVVDRVSSDGISVSDALEEVTKRMIDLAPAAYPGTIDPQTLFSLYSLCTMYAEAMRDGKLGNATNLRVMLMRNLYCLDYALESATAVVLGDNGEFSCVQVQDGGAGEFVADDTSEPLEAVMMQTDVSGGIDGNSSGWINSMWRMFSRAASVVNVDSRVMDISMSEKIKLPLNYQTLWWLSRGHAVLECDRTQDAVERVRRMLYYLLTNYYTPLFLRDERGLTSTHARS